LICLALVTILTRSDTQFLRRTVLLLESQEKPAIAVPVAKYLAIRGEKLVLQGWHLPNINFQNISLVAPNLQDAQLNKATFDGVSAEQAILSGASLYGTEFLNSLLPNSTFNGAKLDGTTKFVSTDLRKANFTNLVISASPIFDYSDLYQADFSGIKLPDGSALVAFGGSNWWLAVGLDPAQHRTRLDRSPPARYLDSKPYSNEMKRRCQDIGVRGISKYNKASALNSLAWSIVINGGRLDEAQSAVDAALTIVEDAGAAGDPDWTKLRREIRETDAQVKLRDGDGQKAAAAAAVYEEIISEAKNAAEGSWYYRYAIALERGGRDASAARTSAGKDFVSSYEDVLFRLDVPASNNRSPLAKCQFVQ
jgi:hypothetical protein